MPHKAPADGRKRRRDVDLKLVVLLGALSAFAPLSLDMYLPALPRLSHALGGPPWALQLTLTACLVGLAGGQLVSGPLSDRVGRRRPLRAGAALLLAVGLAGGGLVGILPGFFLVVSSIGWISPNATALGDHAAEAGSASALLGLAQFVIGGAVAPLAGVAGPRAEMPMMLAIAAASTAATTAYLGLARRRPPSAAPGPRGRAAPYGSRCPRRVFLVAR